MIKTVTLTANTEQAVKIEGGTYCSIENRGEGVVYASKYPDVSALADNVVAIDPGNNKILENATKKSNNGTMQGTIYLITDQEGTVEIRTATTVNPFKIKRKGGGAKVTIDDAKINEDLSLATIKGFPNETLDNFLSLSTEGEDEILNDTPFFTNTGVAIHNGLLHVVGVDDTGIDSTYRAHYVYNGSKWTMYTDTLKKGYVGLCFTYRDKLYIHRGGYYFHLFDDESRTWGDKSEFGGKMLESCVAYLEYNDMLYAFSGSSQKIYIYNGSTWDDSSLSCPIIPVAAIVFNDKIHAFGADGHYTFDRATWERICDFPGLATAKTVVVYDDAIHSVGAKYHYIFNGEYWYGGANIHQHTTDNGDTGATAVYNGHIYRICDFEDVGISQANYYRLFVDIKKIPFSSTDIFKKMVSSSIENATGNIYAELT